MKLILGQRILCAVISMVVSLHKLPLAGFRKVFDLLNRLLGVAASNKSVSSRDLMVPAGDHQVAIRIYRPASSAVTRSLVFFHGGGYVIGGLDSHDGFCQRLAHKAQINVIAVDYRLAPDCKFPGPLEDGLAVWNWVIDNAQSLQLDPQEIGIGGDSAGGNLAAVLSMQLFAESLPGKTLSAVPAFQWLLYPMVDFRGQSASYEKYGSGLLLSKPVAHFFRDSYLNNIAEAQQVSASPLFANDFSVAPDTIIVTVEYDVLRDEGLAFVDQLQRAGVAVSHLHLDDCTHGFISLAKFSPKSRQRVDEICAMVGRSSMLSS